MKENEKTNYLLFDPNLAARIGLNEAIVIHQIEYWLDKYKDDPTHIKDGKVWVYNTYEDWQAQFPFWCLRTVKSIFKNLVDKGILIAGCYNKLHLDKTRWYTIDYEILSSDSATFTPSIVQDLHYGKCKVCTDNTIEYTETTKSKTTVTTVSSFDKQKHDYNPDTFIDNTLPSMLTHIYIRQGNLHMPYSDCLSLIKRFLALRRYYATDEYKLTTETLLKAVNGIEDFWKYAEKYDYELHTEDFVLLMEQFFESKRNSAKHSAYSLNQFFNPNMLLGLYGDVFGIREFSWECNGEIIDVVNA